MAKETYSKKPFQPYFRTILLISVVAVFLIAVGQPWIPSLWFPPLKLNSILRESSFRDVEPNITKALGLLQSQVLQPNVDNPKHITELSDKLLEVKNSAKSYNTISREKHHTYQINQSHASKETFQHIGKECYVYSAYFDKRNTAAVRVFAVTAQDTPSGIFCWLWYKKTKKPVISKVKVQMLDTKKFLIRAAMFICEIADSPGNKTMAPEYISFSHDPNMTISNGMLNIENIHQREQRYKYVVCIHGALRGYNEPIRLVEQVEVHKLFGAEHFAIYNKSAGPLLRPYIDYYKRTGQMDLHQWPVPNTPAHDAGQIALINDCLYMYMYRTKYIALVDMDEFIVPKEHLTWDEMLNKSRCGNHAEAIFSNTFFFPQKNIQESQKMATDKIFVEGDTGKTAVTNTTVIRKNLKTLQRFEKGETYNCGTRSKIIIEPEKIWVGGIHMVAHATEKHCCVETNLGLLQHYRFSSIGERKVKDKTMHKFENNIVNSVKKVFEVVEVVA